MENEVISICQIRTIFSMLRNYQGENIKTDVYSLISDLVDYGIFRDIEEMRSKGISIEEIHRQINIKHSGRPVAGSKGKEIEISEPRLKEKEESPNEAYVRKIKEGGIPINSPKKEKEIIERVSKKLWEQSDVGLKQGFTKHNELPKDVISSDWDDLNEDIKKSWLSYMIPIDTELNDLYFETNTYKEAEELRMKAKHKLNSKDNPGSPPQNKDLMEAKIWYDEASDDEITEALESFGWKPYKFRIEGQKSKYPTWDKLGDDYGIEFASKAKKDLIKYVSKLAEPKDNPGSQNIDWHAQPGYMHDKEVIKEALSYFEVMTKRAIIDEKDEYKVKRIPALIEMIDSGKHVMINDGGECQYQNLQKEKDLEEIKEREKEARALAGKAFSEKFKKEREKGKDNPGQEGRSKFVGLANIRKYIDTYERRGGGKSLGAFYEVVEQNAFKTDREVIHEVVEQYAFETDPEVIDDILRLHRQGEIPEDIFLVMNASAKNLAMAEKELEYNKAIKARKYEEAAKLKEIKESKVPGYVTKILVGRSGLKKRLKDNDLSNVLEAKQDQEGEAGGYKYKVLKEDVKWQLTKL